MGVLFCDTFIIVTVSVSVALDSFHFIHFLTLEPNVTVATPFYVLTDQSHQLAS